MGRQLPRSATNAIRAQIGVVVLSGLTMVLTVVQRDELVRAWASHNPTAKRILDEGGLEALDASAVQPLAFVPVAIVSFVVFALLAAVLLVFFRDGLNSARISLSGLAGFFLLAMVAMSLQEPPILFVVLAAISAVLDVVLVYFLWHRDTSTFLSGAELVSGRHP